MNRRLFLGFGLSAAQQQQCQQLQQAIGAPYRAVISENLHVTALFVGQLNEPQIQRLISGINESISAQQLVGFQIVFDTLVYWSKPQILALEASYCPAALLNIHTCLTQLAAPLTELPAHEQYRPHITLFRKAKALMPMPNTSVTASMNSLALYESVSTTQGVRYQVLEQWSLANS
ncbi:hypothetical protein FLM48_03595 [Shewanella sp. Scap07]|uniref:2'-5' RNA ligase family protein n=1 Tax=Shewanella sp. Scap07 TaxID=2589987 RepID=UPI0015BC1137|nr:hypothetical protein [Shewanella sp. Scap07]QLE84248.1 hypothetical protein FLM48_03595 [Shewanella sp. Scap07]